MSATEPLQLEKRDVYFHIFNRGVEEKILFNDDEDYEVFKSYLEDYLSPPVSPESTKKTFTIKGRVYKGVPHQPKNYNGKVELVAFSLESNHFHLLLHQLTERSIENFIRSLCTRYSIYFNKKYQRSGSLFEGPYKSVQVTDVSQLLHLTRYIHLCPAENDNTSKTNTSYDYYLGIRSSLWVKPKAVLGYFEHSNNKAFKGVDGYKKFVEEYEPEEADKELLKKVIFKEKRQPSNEDIGPQENGLSQQPSNLKPQFRIPETIAAFAVFLFLFGIGYRNIQISSAKDVSSSPAPVVLGTEESKVAKEESKTTLVIKINDGSKSVNIRKSPNISAEKIGQALEGEVFEFVAINNGWYEVRLINGDSGFISAQYIEIQEEVSN